MKSFSEVRKAFLAIKGGIESHCPLFDEELQTVAFWLLDADNKIKQLEEELKNERTN